jgi:membrane-associated phospholipid phosphatase
VCAALLLATWLLAFHVGFVERADQSIFSGFASLQGHGLIYRIATHVARLCNPNPWVYLAVIPVAMAMVRGRIRLAITIGVILLGANCTTELLKPLLAQPRASSLLGGYTPVGPVSWPSGHATAAMSLALSTLLAAPPRLRPAIAALGALFAIAVSYSFLTLGWHYPSDVFGGFLVAATWTLACVGALRATQARDARPATSEPRERVSVIDSITPVVVSLVGAAAALCLLVLLRPHAVISYASGHKAFVIGAGAIGVFGMAVAAGVMLALRR